MSEWEPDPEELHLVKDYLIGAPEQGDWEWEDHCEGLAGGILQALHAAKQERTARLRAAFKCDHPEHSMFHYCPYPPEADA